MPKLKTVKGLKDRVKVTGTGKLMRFRAGRRHLLGGKRAKRKRQMRRMREIAFSEAKKLLRLIP